MLFGSDIAMQPQTATFVFSLVVGEVPKRVTPSKLRVQSYLIWEHSFEKVLACICQQS